MLANLRQRARALNRETYTLSFAYRDPRTPWYARIVAACVVAYAFSPIDLIPDFVPLLGYLDDLILVQVGIAPALRLIPVEVMAESVRGPLRHPSGRRAGSWQPSRCQSELPKPWCATCVAGGEWRAPISLVTRVT
jgi:uncharacterized membrane protein YkvA (DUF1232 family)